MVIYADLVQKVNNEQYLVSYEMRRVHSQKNFHDWLVWLKQDCLTGIDEVDDLIRRLADDGIKDYQNLSLNVVNLFTRDLGKSDRWASDRKCNLPKPTLKK